MIRNAFIIGSLVIHVIVFGYALRVSEKKKQRVATAVVVAEKKKEQEKPKPKPKPIVQKPKVEAPEPTPLKNAPTHSTETAPPPVDSGLTMDNSNAPGIDVGPPKGSTPKQGGAAKQAAPHDKPKEKVLGGTTKGNPEDDNCTEAPSKPS